jgi:hypothetical protein
VITPLYKHHDTHYLYQFLLMLITIVRTLK